MHLTGAEMANRGANALASVSWWCNTTLRSTQQMQTDFYFYLVFLRGENITMGHFYDIATDRMIKQRFTVRDIFTLVEFVPLLILFANIFFYIIIFIL